MLLEIKNLHANVEGTEILKGINLKVNAGEADSPDIYVGETTESAIISGKLYQILQIMRYSIDNDEEKDNGVFILDETETITINSTTGAIITSSETEIGLYKIYIRNNGSYNISEYYLIVLENGVVIVKESLSKVLINSLDNGDKIISDNEIMLFNKRYNKINDQYKNSQYSNLIINIHRNELKKLVR